MSNLYEMFGVDKNLETDGIEVDYGDTRFQIARAGGSNAKFKRVFQAKTKPYRRQMETDTLSEDTSTNLMAETYAEAVILRIDAKDPEWDAETDDEEDEWKFGAIPQPDGTLADDTTVNRVKLLKALPELFTDLQSVAGKVANFRAEEDEEDEGN